MPRSTRHDGPLLALSDGFDERAMRAAVQARREEEESRAAENHAAAEVDDVEIDGFVFHVHAHAVQESARDDETVAESNPPALDDPFEFAADEQILDAAVVDGPMAHEEDEREHRAAEAAVEEDNREARPRTQSRRTQPVRRRRMRRDAIQGITKSAVRRLARKGGIKRICASCLTRPALALTCLIKSSCKFTHGLVDDFLCARSWPHVRRSSWYSEGALRERKCLTET